MSAVEVAPPASRNSSGPHTCILFALPQERKEFRLTGLSGLRVLHSGAGAANAARVAEMLLSSAGDSPPILIVCGFAGALTNAMKPGDIIIADSVANGVEGLDYPKPHLIPDDRLVAAARSLQVRGVRTHKGVLVSGSRVLITAHEKREWSRNSGACAVDMETAGAAAAAVKSGAPWISIRAITDDSETDLPLDFNAFIQPDGSMRLKAITLATLLRPWSIPGMMRLNRTSTLAGRNLALFLESFLRHLPLADETTETGE